MADIKQLSDDEYNRMMHGSFGHAAITQAITQDALQVAPQPAQQPKTSLVQVNPVIPSPVKLPKANAAMPPPQPGEPDAAAVAAQVNQAREALRISTPPPAPPSAVDHLKDQVLENWKIPAIAAATYVGAKAIEYGGKKAIEKGKSVLENRRIAKEANANINRNVDIPFFEPPPPPPLFTPGVPESKLAVESQAKFGAPLADVEKHFNVKITNLKDAEILTNNYKNYMNSLSGAVSNQPAGIPTGTSPMNSLINQRLSETPAAQKIVSNELLTGTGKPAYAGQGPAAELRTKGKKAGEPLLRNNYAKVEDVPAGYAFVPNAQNIDSSRLMIGQPEYTNAYSKRDFPSSYEASILEANEINRALGRPTRAEAKAAGLTLPPQTPGITKSVLESKETPFMGTKTAKVGGILGALIAIPDLVNAQTVGQRGMAGANLLEAVLPPGFTMSGAGEGSSNVPSTANAMLLGSPYAQSPEAKKLRQEQEYVRKVGAGRGIAPPSAYFR